MQNIKTFGRTRGRPLSFRKASLVDARLADFLLPVEISNEGSNNFDPKSLMPNAKAVWFEIGFGGSEHLIAQAKANPDTLIIGAEPFFDGVAKALDGIIENKLENVRLINDDARKYLANFQDNSIDRIFIMFPDPWQKLRHRKRRLVNDAFAHEITRLLKNDGKLRFATDWANYAETALLALTKNPSLKWLAEGPEDWLTPPQDHFTTRYQLKGLGDCAPHFFDFIKI